MKNTDFKIEPIAYIHTDFSEKFGVPRQSGLNQDLKGKIIFEPEYRVAEAVRGLDGYSHIWLIWYFSKADRNGWSPTVRPPKLGGNTRMGVFATRSPFRPNSMGLSCVKLEKIELSDGCGPILYVSGIDIMDGTPILDIKPYLPYADSYPDATGGFTDKLNLKPLQVDFPEAMLEIIPKEKRQALIGVLESDPRPSYQNDPERIYGFGFAGYEIKFKVNENLLTVTSVEKSC